MKIVHLVSDQTLQNLLPLLAYRPDKVIQVRSAEARFGKQSLSLKAAALLHDFHDEAFHTNLQDVGEACIAMAQVSPTADETLAFFKQLHQTDPVTLVNITGGTKLMAVGALKFAEAHGVPWIYVDSPRGFVCSSDHTARCSLQEAAGKLTIRSALAASGLDPFRLKKDDPTSEMVASAEAIFDLRSTRSGIEAHRFAVQSLRDALFQKNRNGRLVLKHGDNLRNALGEPFKFELPDELLDTLSKTEIVRQDQGKWFFAPRALHGDGKAMENIVEWNLRFFEGGWYELHVVKRMRDSGHFTEVRWSVESRDRAASVGETDIIAFDRRSLSLVFVSCKTSDAHVGPLEHVFSVRQRASQFGGTFAATVFCFATILDNSKRQTLRDGCATVRARLVEGETGIDQWLQ